MENLNKKSKPYLTGEYDEMFNAAEIASMAAEDIVAYRNSILEEMERESEIKYAKEEGFKEGFLEGFLEGFEEGFVEGFQLEKEKGKLDVARKMKEYGVDLGDIMLYTGLTEQQIAEL